MKTSAISWTDYSGGVLNFVRGCTPVSEGCTNCYARAIYDRFGRDFSQVVCDDDALRKLLTVRFPQYSPKRGAPHKPMAFVCDTGDLFHETVTDGFIETALSFMSSSNDVIWQILTKRPTRMRAIVSIYCKRAVRKALPSHVWLGVTAENQRRADERIPILLDTPAAVRFVSVEPMLEHIDLSYCKYHEYSPTYCTQCTGHEHLCHGWLDGIDWVICGAESGPKRRPFDVSWALNLYEQCREAGVPFFAKQDSDLRPGKPLVLPGHGVVHEWPEERV